MDLVCTAISHLNLDNKPPHWSFSDSELPASVPIGVNPELEQLKGISVRLPYLKSGSARPNPSSATLCLKKSSKCVNNAGNALPILMGGPLNNACDRRLRCNALPSFMETNWGIGLFRLPMNKSFLFRATLRYEYSFNVSFNVLKPRPCELQHPSPRASRGTLLDCPSYLMLLKLKLRKTVLFSAIYSIAVRNNTDLSLPERRRQIRSWLTPFAVHSFAES